MKQQLVEIHNKLAVTTSEAAELSNININEIRSDIKSGELPATNKSTGRQPKWSILRVDLDAYVVRKHRKANPNDIRVVKKYI